MRIPLSPDAYPHILTRVKQAGFTVFESVDYDMNIIGERNPHGEPDRFAAWLHICYLAGGSWQCHAYRCWVVLSQKRLDGDFDTRQAVSGRIHAWITSRTV